VSEELYPLRDAIAAALAASDMRRFGDVVRPYGLSDQQRGLVLALAKLASDLGRDELERLARGGAGRRPPAA
jgi:hypothetical protein